MLNPNLEDHRVHFSSFQVEEWWGWWWWIFCLLARMLNLYSFAFISIFFLGFLRSSVFFHFLFLFLACFVVVVVFFIFDFFSWKERKKKTKYAWEGSNRPKVCMITRYDELLHSINISIKPPPSFWSVLKGKGQSWINRYPDFWNFLWPLRGLIRIQIIYNFFFAICCRCCLFAFAWFLLDYMITWWYFEVEPNSEHPICWAQRKGHNCSTHFLDLIVSVSNYQFTTKKGILIPFHAWIWEFMRY